ncbi:MAG: DUF3833 family protein [Kangiellaceae bacterium]
MNKKSMILYSLFMLSSCSVNPELYKSTNSSLSFSNYFKGKLCAWGTVKDRSMQVTRKFVANIDASQNDSKIVLNEQFNFSDGEQQTRVWEFIENNNQIIGTAGDVVGKAQGEIYGDSLHLTYILDIPQEDGSIQVNMDDWLHLIDANTLMGSTKMTKWGFYVGQIDIVIQKRAISSDCFAGLLTGTEKRHSGESNAAI